MMAPFVLAALLLGTSVATAQNVPSGQPLTLQEVLVDDVANEVWLRFRFVAPQVARGSGTRDYDAVTGDMAHLCETFAIPYDAEYDLAGDVIVISLADRPTEFGVADPDATQLFEAFRPVDNACMLEGL
jgi:hypothetical protein